MSRLRQWWHREDQYEWVTLLLRRRGMLLATQRIMATVAGSAALVPLSHLIAARRYTAESLAVGLTGAVFTVGMMIYWLNRWPSRRQSAVIVIAGTVVIALWSLTQPVTALALLACAATAITGGYMAFFHGAKPLAFNFVVALLISVVASVRLELHSDFTSAVAAFWLIWFLNVSVPLAAYGAAGALREYLVRSDADPLTGLLNRRAFMEAVTHQLVDHDPSATHVTLVMVDLDDFKAVNDTRGHAAGDRVLLDVADLLRRLQPPAGIACRAGGEEFLIAIFGEPISAQAAAWRLCASLAALPHGVTASIGTTTIVRDDLDRSPTTDYVGELIAAADRAMYVAKRNGGNRVHRDRASIGLAVQRPDGVTSSH
jgi:diguanylate cyclase